MVKWRKFLSLLSFAVVSLWRFRGKYLPLLGVYAVLVGFLASVVMLTSALRREARAVLGDKSPDLWIQKLAGGRLAPMPIEFGDSLFKIRGVGKVVPRLWGYVFDSPTGALFTVMGIDSLSQLPYIQGVSGLLDTAQAICGSGFLQTHGLTIGDALTLETSEGRLKSFRIVGEFSTESDLLTRDLVLLSRRSAAQVLGYEPQQVTDFALYVPNPLEVNHIARKLNREYGGIRIATRSQLLASYDAVFGWRGGLFTLGCMISGLAFLVLLWDKAASFSGRERKETLLLKALGWSNRDLLRLRLLEGGVVSVSATLAGLLLGYLHVFHWDAVLLKQALSGWAVLLPSYRLPAVVAWSDVVTVFAFSVAPYLLASLVPAWLSTVVSAEEALR